MANWVGETHWLLKKKKFHFHEKRKYKKKIAGKVVFLLLVMRRNLAK